MPPIGPVTLADFDPAAFAADTGAVAVVMSQFGRISIVSEAGQYKVKFERTRRVKILREEGLKEASTAINLYHRDGAFEQVVNVHGTVFNVEKGKVSRTETKNAAATTVNIDDHNDERRLTLAGARVGSVVEIGYTTLSDFLFTLPDWWFQETIPVRRSELRVIVPQLFNYGIRVHTYYPFAVETNEQKLDPTITINGQQCKAAHLTWGMVNLPAFREEPYITTPADYLAGVKFQLQATIMPGSGYTPYATSWPKTTAELLLQARFGGALGFVGDINKALKDLREAQPDLALRAEAVVELVRGAMVWNGHDGLQATGPIDDAIRRKRGNAAEVNLMLVSALRSAGITADPVIVSTRDHGAVNDEMPLLNRFNFVLAQARIPGQPSLLLDATAPHAAKGMLPERCLNTRGRVISEDAGQQQWVTVQSPHKYTLLTTGTLSPDAQGGIKGNMRSTFSGYYGQRVRYRAEELAADKLASKYVSTGTEVKQLRPRLTQPEDPSQPVILEVDVATEGEGQPAPLLFVNLKDFGGMSENPFHSIERQFPVDLGAPLAQTMMLDVQVPDGYQIETVPPVLNIRTPDGAVRAQFACTPAADGRSVQITSGLMMNKVAFQPEEYESLRSVYERLVTKHAEPLVLKKRTQ